MACLNALDLLRKMIINKYGDNNGNNDTSVKTNRRGWISDARYNIKQDNRVFANGSNNYTDEAHGVFG